MNPERWRQIEEVYHGALEQAAGHREIFLTRVCGSDHELRQEVMALLAQPSDGAKLDGQRGQ
jgi:hypothetical protein